MSDFDQDGTDGPDDVVTVATTSQHQRIIDDDRTLRRLPLPGKTISNDIDDYDEMRALFCELAETMRAIRSDPNALKSPFGGYDVGMIRAMTGMIDALRKIISDVNKMKNSDRLTLAILEGHTKTMSQNLAIPLGEKIRIVLSQLESVEGADAAYDTLMSLVSGDIVEIFRNAATQAMTSSREQYNLH